MRIITNRSITLQFDVVRISIAASEIEVDSYRWGIWGMCYGETIEGINQLSCANLGVGYEVDTRGLVVHVVGAC